MFTVKQIVKNATSLFEIKHLTIARAGSEQWRQALARADELGLDTPDIIEMIPEIFEDEAMTKPIGVAHDLSVERSGVARQDLIGIICTDLKSPMSPSLPDADGIAYQFIYKGDQVFVTNAIGATVETVK